MNENQSIVERIEYFAKYKNLSIRRFEQSINFSNGFLSTSKKHNSIGVDKVLKILDVYKELSIVWLLTGKGEMTEKNKNENNYYKQDIVNSAAAESVATYNTMNECEKEVATLKQRIKDLEKQVELFEMLLKK